MDKYEYKIRSEEIKTLIAKGEYADAAAIADTVDWRRVKSVMMLCTISDLYKINRRYEDARDMLLLAYDRHPGGRSIVYSLCELSIKMGEFVQAVEYYKEFVQIAPRDSGRYVLQYKLYEAQEVSLEERIAVLEELKAKDYSEKWAYELAYLYHRVGLATRCVEECDELILWFGEGKYVLKALELKKLHEPLTVEQQERYDDLRGFGRPAEAAEQELAEQAPEADLEEALTKEIPQQEIDIQVKLMNVGEYDTINMQKELAQNMKELWEGPSVEEIEKQEAYHTEAASELISDTSEPVEEEPAAPEETKVEEVFFGETGEMDSTATQIMEEMKKEIENPTEDSEQIISTQTGDMTEWHVGGKGAFEKILGMEYDGQISMLMPDSEQVEKQITGQISLEDVLLEWEKVKKDSEQKRMEAVRQHVMEQTGAMFTEFDAATRDGLLEQLEKGNDTSVANEAEEITEEIIAEEEFLEDAATEEEAIPTEALSEDIEEFYDGEAEEVEEPEDFYEAEGVEEAEAFYETEELEEIEDFGEAEEAEEPEAFEEAEEAEESEDFEEAEEVEEPEDFEETEEAEEPEDFEETEEAEEPEDFRETEEAEEPEETEEAEEVEEPEETEKAEEPPKTVKGPEEQVRTRPLSLEERQLFGAYIQSRTAKDQIVNAIDNISMAAYTGNVIITGEEGMDTLALAKNLIKEVQQTDSNFSGKIAKISGDSLNRKDVAQTLEKLKNGALIVQGAGSLKTDTVEQLKKALEQENTGMIVVLEGARKSMHKLLKNNHTLTECFNIQINIEALDNDTLVSFAKKYAREQEYSIDELGVLALHTCIADRQTSDHAVTISEVKEIMDAAIHNANRKTLGHFFDILVAKRYDDEDMIILREKDFI